MRFLKSCANWHSVCYMRERLLFLSVGKCLLSTWVSWPPAAEQIEARTSATLQLSDTHASRQQGNREQQHLVISAVWQHRFLQTKKWGRSPVRQSH